jgi:hypothetical protein
MPGPPLAHRIPPGGDQEKAKAVPHFSNAADATESGTFFAPAQKCVPKF